MRLIFIFSTLISMALFGSLKADYISLEKLLEKAKKENLSLPKPQKDGRFQTLNKRGAALPVANKFIDAFIKYASEGEKNVLQIETTFGHIMLDALQNKVSSYVATDSDERHLAIIAKRANALLSKENLNSLKLFHGEFPADFSKFKSNTFDAILFNRVLHFYSPAQATRALKEAFRVLKPTGKVFIISITPYVNRFKSFIPQYKQRLLLKHQYPGHVKNLKHFINPEVTTPKQLRQLYNKSFMFFDAQFMHSFLSEMGFIVEKSIEFPLGFKSSIWELDGRELVGAIAHKPLYHPNFPMPTH